MEPEKHDLAHRPAATDPAEVVLARIPSGAFVLSASHDDCRSGVLVHWVQRCSSLPPMVLVAMRKGHPIEPIIRDSRTFCLNLLHEDEVFLRRKFETAHGHGEDPFVSLPCRCAPSGAPILLRAVAWIDCDLARHLDIESEFEIYVGLVRAAGENRGRRVADEDDRRIKRTA